MKHSACDERPESSDNLLTCRGHDFAIFAPMGLTPAGTLNARTAFDGTDEAGLGALSLPWIVGCYFAFRPAFVVVATRLLAQSPQAGPAISLSLNFVLLGLAAFQSVGPQPRAQAPALSGACGRWMLVFLGFSGLSLIWTVAASPAAAAAFWCGMAADVAIVVLLLRVYDPLETARALIGGFVFGACCFALLGWVLPAQSDLRLGDEDYLGANQFGFVCAFGILLGQYASRLHPARKHSNLAQAFLAVTLLRTLSKTSIAAFLAAEIFLLVRDKSIRRKTKAIILLAGAAVIAGSWGLLRDYLDLYMSAGNQAETLTGRLGLWAIFLAEALDRPWFGHGFHSVWQVIPPFGPDRFEPRHAHNELLQQFYAYGAAGVVMMVGIYGSFYRRVKQFVPSPQRTALFSLLIFVLIRGLADTDPFDLSLPLWAMVLLLASGNEFHLQTSAAQ
jgi:exopolysaccharide production protein ExoQ